MVKVFGPAMSLDASGSLANTITFSKWKGRNYVRERVIPSNPKSGAQTGRRAMFKFLTQAWAAISVSDKATWQTLADELVASPFNAYLKDNMQNWHNFKPPTQAAARAEVGLPSDRDIDSAAWEENRIKITSSGAVVGDPWGTLFFASTTAVFTPSVGNCIIAEFDADIASRQTFWTPPSVATWYINIMTFTTDGVKGLAGTETTATP